MSAEPIGAGAARQAEIAEAQHAERCTCLGCRSAGFVLGMWVTLTGVIVGFALQGCAHVCPSGWEAGTTVGHSAFFGQTVDAHVTISGDIGRECREPEK